VEGDLLSHDIDELHKAGSQRHRFFGQHFRFHVVSLHQWPGRGAEGVVARNEQSSRLEESDALLEECVPVFDLRVSLDFTSSKENDDSLRQAWI
jgi:hypothetical protein